MPRLGEDLRNVTLIAGSAFAGLVGTGVLLAVAFDNAPRVVEVAPVVEVRVERGESRVVEAPEVVTSGQERLFGRVRTVDGQEIEGFLRWDRNEGAWADLLDAVKTSGRGVATQTGVRFGNVDRIEVTGGRTARVVMISGEAFDLQGGSSDLGHGMRSLRVEPTTGEPARLEWADLDEVDFYRAPDDARTTEQRLHGTVTTDSGLEFTGFVTWDIDEIYASDVLDGESDGADVDVPFGAIASIERRGFDGVRVTLKDGERLHLSGTDDVSSGNAGITVSDPGLGQIKVEWDDFDSVRFFPAGDEARRTAFGGDGPVTGTVIGSSGDSWSGRVTWDQDESRGWEILNGHLDDAEFFVEFGRVARIEKTASGSRLTLKDGRSFDLTDSQDVGRGNRGIRIEGTHGSKDLTWDEFRELRLDG